MLAGIRRYQAVVIGASAGGSKALLPIIQALPKDFLSPVIVVQHLHPLQDGPAMLFAAQECVINLREAEEKEVIKAGNVYFAPPNYHLMVEIDQTFSLTIDPKVNYSRPSIDVLFESAADVYGSTLIGIVLSGANNDGAAGLKYIQSRGGLAIVQEPQSAEVPFMPNSAIRVTDPDHILPPTEIGELLVRLNKSSVEDEG